MRVSLRTPHVSILHTFSSIIASRLQLKLVLVGMNALSPQPTESKPYSMLDYVEMYAQIS